MTADGPRDEDEGADPDPFADLDGTGLPLEEGDALGAEPEASVEPEAHEDAASTAATAMAPVEPPQPQSTRSRRGFRLLLAASVLFIACVGWLGWEYMQDRDSLAALEQDLLGAREAASSSAVKAEDSGEGTQASALQQRVAATLSAPWWQAVAVRIIDAERIESARAQADELAQQASDRAANRQWWRGQLASVEETLASPARTIPAVMAASDAFSDAAEPHAGAGGFSPDDRTATIERCAADSAQLLEQQNAAIAALDAALAAVRESSTIEEHAQRALVLDAPLPTDRNPPELEQAQAAARQQSTDIREFLLTRDRLLGEVVETVGVLESYDLNDGSQQAVAAIAQRLDTLALPADSRFDTIRERASHAEDLAMAALARLRERDDALAWIEARRTDLDAIQSLEDLARFTEGLAVEHPSSGLPRVAQATEELAGRVTMRRTTLEEEKRLRDESLARAAAFEVGWTEAEDQLARGLPSRSAEALGGLAAETPDQAERLARTRAQFGGRAKARVDQLVGEARASGQWGATADAIRQALDSPSVAALAPALSGQLASAWEEASLGEDHELYLAILGVAAAPIAEIAPLAQRYLDEARLRGATAPMRAHIEQLVAVLQDPGVTIEVEGVEWAQPECAWNAPSTQMTVLIGEDPLEFTLGDVAPGEVSLLGGERWLQDAASSPVQFGVSGYFDCADDDGVFAGSGALSMGDLACGGRLALPFWNDADQSTAPHNLLLIAIPDPEVQAARTLPAWADPRAPVQEESTPLLMPSPSLPIDPTDPSNDQAVKE